VEEHQQAEGRRARGKQSKIHRGGRSLQPWGRQLGRSLYDPIAPPGTLRELEAPAGDALADAASSPARTTMLGA